MKPVRLILASSSPRRREILSSLSLSFKVLSPEIDESPVDGEPAVLTVRRLALEKAKKVSAVEKDSLVIGADTLVTLDGKVLGKPDDGPHAAQMLSELSGKTHEVLTGLAFVKEDEKLAEVAESRSEVTFRKLSRTDIDGYVASGEPIGKAGGYAIQGMGRGLIECYKGSFTNIVGLPITELLRFLIKFGTDRLEWTS